MKYLKDIQGWKEMIGQTVCSDCLLGMKLMPDNSVDAIVTDPPYGLSFMGKKWDYDVPSVEIWKECLRVLKPGGYLLAFAGTRTQHRMACNIEDGGFEIRDMIAWVYGSGFSKSLNIGKAIDKLQGNEREVVDKIFPDGSKPRKTAGIMHGQFENKTPFTKGTSEWEGWGTSLKPSHEPVICSTKPLTLELIFAKMGIDITNEIINLCQKYNVNVNDVEQALKSIHLKLEKAGVNTVAENARTCDWENIESVVIAGMSFTSPKPISKEPLEGYKVVSAPVSVNQNGNEYLQENETLIGTAEDLSEQMDILLSTLATRNIDSNTVWLWKSILENVLQKAGTFTTSMALKTTIAWKTYKSLLSANTQNFTSDYQESKPSLEPITVARKPLGEKTIAENCLRWGTGGINIDISRIKTEDKLGGGGEKKSSSNFEAFDRPWKHNKEHQERVANEVKGKVKLAESLGRFPANLIHDNSEEVRECFPETKSTPRTATTGGTGGVGVSTNFQRGSETSNHNDSGNASRFFYCAKASKRERMGSTHPTMKPIALMEYLVRLVSRKDALILDPFTGSGSTLVACKRLDRNFIGFEMDGDYCKISDARVEHWKGQILEYDEVIEGQQTLF